MKKLSEADKMVQLMIRVAPGMIVRLDNWRRVQADIPGRAEAVRRLVDIGLKAKQTSVSQKGKGK
jgi:hypothetical protein